MHERLKNRTFVGKKFFFNILGIDFLPPERGHRREKRSVLEPANEDLIICKDHFRVELYLL